MITTHAVELPGGLLFEYPDFESARASNERIRGRDLPATRHPKLLERDVNVGPWREVS